MYFVFRDYAILSFLSYEAAVYVNNETATLFLDSSVKSFNKKSKQLKETYKSSQVKDLEYIKDTFLDFCKNQTLKNALIRSVDLLELGDYDDIRNLIDKALKAGVERDLGHEYIAEIEDRYRAESRYTIETPWPAINTLLLGGLGERKVPAL